MNTIFPTFNRYSINNPAHHAFVLPALLVSILCSFLIPTTVRADEKLDVGTVISDPNSPIVPDLLRRLEGPLKRYKAEQQRSPDIGAFRLIYDFNPDGKPNSSDNYPACLALTEDLLKAQKSFGVEVIGYVHGEVSKHSVLPLLACSIIVMSEDGKVGKVLDDKAPPLPKDQLVKYDDLVGTRLHPIALKKLYDADLAVLRVEKRVNKDELRTVYLDAKQPNPMGQVVDDLKSGGRVEFDAASALKYGLRTDETTFKNLNELLNKYLPERRLRFTASDHGVVRRIIVGGVITNTSKEELRDQLKTALAQQATLIIVQLECGDGDSQAAYEMAKNLAEINEGRENKVETLAYVTELARNTAAFLAFGCGRIAMQPKALLVKDFDRYLTANPSLENVLRDNLAEIAQRQGHSEALARALVTRDQPLNWVKRIANGPSEKRFILGPYDAATWGMERLVKEPGGWLALSARDAVDFHVADRIAESFEQLCELESIKPGDVVTMDTYLFKWFADLLRNPWVAMALVMIGITCLFLEMKMPGVGLPGVIAAVCFVLFFWSQSQMAGQVIWLAILLFVLGLAFVAIEVFLLPGMAVFGVSGALLVLGSLGLVTYGQLPRSSEQWLELGGKVGPFGLVFLGAMVAAITIANYLPYIPILNRMVHKPPEDQEDGAPFEMHPDLSGLLGAIGVAATVLRPAGKAQFGDQFLDVVSQGSYIQPGTRVQVIEIEGNRIVVKDV